MEPSEADGMESNIKTDFVSWDEVHKGTEKETEPVSEAVSEEASAPETPTEKTAGKYDDLPVDEDGIRQFITKDMLIGDVIELYPEAAKALLSVGMHCVTCGVALYESVEEASYVHGLDPDDVIKVVNDMLTTELIEHPGETF
jgi:hybrid cluster-associated redox disulfide protein